MREWRCPVCSRLLLKGSVERVQIKCPRCRALIELEATGKARLPGTSDTGTVKGVIVPLRPSKARAVNG